MQTLYPWLIFYFGSDTRRRVLTELSLELSICNAGNTVLSKTLAMSDFYANRPSENYLYINSETMFKIEECYPFKNRRCLANDVR
ncbi:hypothetical protein T4A_4951 [Trichinella pseudospiralis]|uniref:Uncharacterized protein n=1 Tax=Trichinella pseudospiralis TaxID=6337 RepID=A0A0V1EI28_TRIPS|nr:hypothetical protein T4A_4951 [Trichinella pseudospiralis]